MFTWPDTRAIKPFGKEMQDWINQQWLARAVQAGIKYIAFVTPASAIARLSITTWKPAEFYQATTSAIFDDLQKGRQWISQQ